ncbi:hypothetical protein niasHT_037558 [Heterodera trifolii]|uniref:Uncharacterized protein n=1 Tax=Heterodera trifolii TaxID=157864 RepID=A0ABD2IUX5_9BILA
MLSFLSFVCLTFLLVSIQTFFAPLNANKGLTCWRGVTAQRGREIEEERETIECQADQRHCGRSKCIFGGLRPTEQRTYKGCVNSCDELRANCEQSNGTYLECNLCSLDKCNFEDYPAALESVAKSEPTAHVANAEKAGEVGTAPGGGSAVVGPSGNAAVSAGIVTMLALLITFVSL